MNRSRNFSPSQDQIIVDAVSSGGFNNLQATFEHLSQLRIFTGYSPKKIENRYYWTLRRNFPMYQIISLTHADIKARVNYKNDPAHWTGATRRNNNRNLEENA